MAYERVDANQDVLTVNGFQFEINNQRIASVINCGGFNRTIGGIEWVDGGTGITDTFSDQKKVYGPITIKFRVDPTTNEFNKLRSYVTASHLLGVKFNFAIVKYHYQVELFRILVYNGLFKEEQWSEFDKNGSGPFEGTLNVPCSFWEILTLSVKPLGIPDLVS